MWIVGLAVAFAARVPAAGAQAPQGNAAGGIHTLHVQGNVYMLVGAGGNITLQIGEDGVLLVDTGNGQSTNQVVNAIAVMPRGTVRQRPSLRGGILP